MFLYEGMRSAQDFTSSDLYIGRECTRLLISRVSYICSTTILIAV